MQFHRLSPLDSLQWSRVLVNKKVSQLSSIDFFFFLEFYYFSCPWTQISERYICVPKHKPAQSHMDEFASMYTELIF